MFRRILLMSVLTLLTATVCQAQRPMNPPPSSGDIPMQSVYLEFAGNGIIYSLNYDILFSNDWGLRLGTSYYPLEDDNGQYTDVGEDAFIGLVMGYRSVGENAHKLEIGGGIVFGTLGNQRSLDVPVPPGATASIGYRFYPREDSRATFKAAFTPMVNSDGFHARIGITLTPEGDADWP